MLRTAEENVTHREATEAAFTARDKAGVASIRLRELLEKVRILEKGISDCLVELEGILQEISECHEIAYFASSAASHIKDRNSG